jgi:hypothetical protein
MDFNQANQLIQQAQQDLSILKANDQIITNNQQMIFNKLKILEENQLKIIQSIIDHVGNNTQREKQILEEINEIAKCLYVMKEEAKK